jgi:hypothetical protein
MLLTIDTYGKVVNSLADIDFVCCYRSLLALPLSYRAFEVAPKRRLRRLSDAHLMSASAYTLLSDDIYPGPLAPHPLL